VQRLNLRPFAVDVQQSPRAMSEGSPSAIEILRDNVVSISVMENSPGRLNARQSARPLPKDSRTSIEMTKLFVPETIGLEKMPNGGAVGSATLPHS
jgi:hypothetical protein